MDKKTRLQSLCPVIGESQELKEDSLVLPTMLQVLKYHEKLRNDHLKLQETKREPAKSTLSSEVASVLKKIWDRASIPCIQERSIQRVVEKCYSQAVNLRKLLKLRPNSETHQRQLKDFLATANKLLDVARCKCKDFSQCKCDDESKVPEEEREFFTDQKEERKLIIGSVDRTITNLNSEKAAQAQKLEERKAKRNAYYQKMTSSLDTQSTISTHSRELCVKEIHFPVIDQAQNCNEEARTGLVLNAYARACDRRKISDRAAAQLASALLADIRECIPEANTLIVTDRSKVRRDRKKLRKSLQECTSFPEDEIWGLFFDGRKDKTISYQTDEAGNSHRRSIKEEHISILSEPGSNYVGHVTPEDSTGLSIATAIFDYLEEQEADIDKVVAVGSDGTATNTGVHKGAIAIFEKKRQWPVQWQICMLHFNELPFKQVCIFLDGPTTEPQILCGPIGKALQNCAELPVVKFKAVPCDLPDIDFDDISTDQRYLYEISQAVAEGECSPGLAARNPGAIHSARWLTTANRVLRLYTSSEQPSKELKKLVKFVQQVYCPMWFYIKTQNSCADGPRHVWKIISLSNYLEPKLKQVVYDAIQRNAFFAHPENMLISMLADKNVEVRKTAVERILIAKNSPSPDKVRQFRIPPLNFNAFNYTELIEWNSVDITMPPLLSNLSEDEIKCFIHGQPEARIFKFPCHSQAVERCVQLVTDASQQVCGQSERDGFIRTTLLDRKILPVFETKCQFKTE